MQLQSGKSYLVKVDDALKIRTRAEEIIGSIKVVGELHHSRYRGQERTQAWGYFFAGTYNLSRTTRLELTTVCDHQRAAERKRTERY
jgi:hypothetical protein